MNDGKKVVSEDIYINEDKFFRTVSMPKKPGIFAKKQIKRLADGFDVLSKCPDFLKNKKIVTGKGTHLAAWNILELLQHLAGGTDLIDLKVTLVFSGTDWINCANELFPVIRDIEVVCPREFSEIIQNELSDKWGLASTFTDKIKNSGGRIVVFFPDTCPVRLPDSKAIINLSGKKGIGITTHDMKFTPHTQFREICKITGKDPDIIHALVSYFGGTYKGKIKICRK